MKNISKIFECQHYRTWVKPIILGVITLSAISLSIWLVWYLNPTTTSKDAEFFKEAQQILR